MLSCLFFLWNLILGDLIACTTQPDGVHVTFYSSVTTVTAAFTGVFTASTSNRDNNNI